MIAPVVRVGALCAGLLAVTAPVAHAATPREIDRAIQGGAAALKLKYGKGVLGAGAMDTTYGSACLAGLALLEAGTPITDPAVKAIADAIRSQSYTQNRTYYVALFLMFLDRHGEPNDVPLIHMLAVRLLVGQTAAGGWTYECCPAVPQNDVDWLKANLKPNQLVAGGAGKPPKLHADAERYGQALTAAKAQGNNALVDDNSNTQFAIVALWMSRKHGAPVDTALDLIEKRFMGSQDLRTGNWPYSGGTGGVGSPSMYCAGLLGMATGLARREERRVMKADVPAAPKKEPSKGDKEKPDDPFYNPPTPKEPVKKPPAARPVDERDAVVQRAFAGLGLTIADQIRSGKGLLFAGDGGGGHGTGDLYFLWSLERVGVVYGMEKIGGFDWYDIGSTALVRSQNRDGTWTVGGSYGAEVNTPFAVLFLCRSNLARDLSSKVQRDPTSTEMRAGAPAPTDVVATRPTAAPAAAPVINLPNPTGDEAITLASKMLKSSGSDWAKLLAEARDTKGATNTRALVVIATHSGGDRKAAAREALAERLCRMTPATLRTMLKADEPELRRGAALACAMKDDKEHIPDLIAALTDPDDAVTRAAKAGLKSLSGKDFGPPAVPTADQKTAAAAAWREWYTQEKK